MVKVVETRSYTLTCSHCTNVIVVEKLEREINGWVIKGNSIPVNVKSITDIKCPDCVKKEYDALYNGTFEQRCKTRYFDEKGHNFCAELAKELRIENHPKKDKLMYLVRDHDDSWHNQYCYAQELLELLS